MTIELYIDEIVLDGVADDGVGLGEAIERELVALLHGHGGPGSSVTGALVAEAIFERLPARNSSSSRAPEPGRGQGMGSRGRPAVARDVSPDRSSVQLPR